LSVYSNDVLECTGSTYGKNCSEMCGCNITNSLNENQTCDIMTGQCKCKAGWYGDSCNDDVNECEDIRSCSTINDTTCVNTFGSFLCDCLRGFTKSSDGACIIGKSVSYSYKVYVIVAISNFLNYANIYKKKWLNIFYKIVYTIWLKYRKSKIVFAYFNLR
jgi:hypothetical protein